MQVVSKLTSKYQATIPASVREALGIKQGDSIAFDYDASGVRLRRAQPIDLIYAQALPATLEEWYSAADEMAYREL